MHPVPAPTRTPRQTLAAAGLAISGLALAGLALAGCAGAAAEPPPAKRFEQDMMVRLHMRESFGLLHMIERQLRRGQLEPARELALAMAQAPDDPGLSAWAAHSARVRGRSAALAAATKLDDALRLEARVVEACATCHVDAGAQLELRKPPPAPPDHPSIDARMARHVWATERLWDGMLGDADKPWRAGLEVLAATPLPPAALGARRAPLATQLQQLATRTLQQRGPLTPAARAIAYGEILVACASCHTAPAQRP